MDRLTRFYLGFGLAFATLLSTGCSTGLRLAYNNLDRLTDWELADYVELDAPQKAAFDAAFKPLWDWHRQTQLPLYARDLREFAAVLDRGPATRELAADFFERIERHGETFGEKAFPEIERLLPLLEDRQVVQIVETQHKKIEREERKLSRETPETRRKRYARKIAEAMHWWIGDLNDVQKQAIDETWAAGLARLRSADQRKQTRLNNLQHFADLLASRGKPGLGARIHRFGENDDPSEVALQASQRAQVLDIAAKMDDRQRNILRDRLLGLAADFESLSNRLVASEARFGA